MAIHTLQLVSKPLSLQRHRRCVNQIFELAREKECYPVYNKNGTLAFKMRDCKGIIVAIMEYMIPHITITINPSILLGGKYDDLCEITAVNFEYCAGMIDEVLAQLKINLTCSQLILSRIDCTVDIAFPSEAEIMEYIFCLKRTELAPAYKTHEFDPSADERNAERNQHSFRVACQDVSLTVYDKSYQLADQGLMLENEIPPNRLRVEAAFESGAFQRLFYRYGKFTLYDTTKEKIVWFSEMSVRLLEDYFRRTLAPGDYLRFDLAVRKIEESNFSRKKKERMLGFLHQVVRCHKNGVRKAIRRFKERGYSSSQVKGVLNSFQEIGLNPVTIHNDSTLERFPCIPEMLMGKNALPALVS